MVHIVYKAILQKQTNHMQKMYQLKTY